MTAKSKSKFKLKKRHNYIIGIDEAGRGPLAGPVTAAAVILPRNFSAFGGSAVGRQFSISNFQKNSKFKLRDSKKLTPKQREIWFQYITKELALPHVVASVSAKIIDKINISNAANLAARRAFEKLIANCRIANCKIFLDGGLYLDKSKIKKQKFKTPRTNCFAIIRGKQIKNVKTIIKGDERIPVIALASIVVKVSRDRMMLRFHKKYPQYGFDRHKGYGTKKHIKAIKKFGYSPIHRKSFKIK